MTLATDTENNSIQALVRSNLEAECLTFFPTNFKINTKYNVYGNEQLHKLHKTLYLASTDHRLF